MTACLEIARQCHHPWREQTSFANFIWQLGLDESTVRVNIKLYAMFNDIEQLLRQINLLQSHFCLIKRNQSAAANFFSREFMDYNLIDFVGAERLAGVLLVPLLAADFAFLLFLPARLRIDNIR